MWYLIQQYWLWLLGALAIGLAIGWLTFLPASRTLWPKWISIVAIAFVIGLVLAGLKAIPGVAGLWLDTALLFFTSYIIGCFLGSWLHGSLQVPEAEQTMAVARPAAMPAAMMAPVAAAEPAPAATSAPVPASPHEPMPAARIEGEEKIAGQRPPGLAAPRNGQADDLKLVKGIGRQNEGRLHGLGIWHFDQIATWSKQNVLWVGSYLAFPGRIEREDWVKQARQLAAGKETEFSKRARWGLVATSADDGSRGQSNVVNLARKDGDKP